MEIISICCGLGIRSVEWGGDIHVPHGDIAVAERTSSLCKKEGISCPSYGSYYKVGISENQGLSFKSVLNTARALGAETVRVWAGEKDYEFHSQQELKTAADDTRRIADMAAEAGLTVSFEYHENSLTRTPESLKTFDRLIDHPGIRYYWQPPHFLSDEDCLASLKVLGDRLTNLHVFQWRLTGESDPRRRLERLSLEAGRERWLRFFRSAETGRDHHAFLEFVRDDDPAGLKKEWTVLKDILSKVEN